jgi:hypothetical protein
MADSIVTNGSQPAVSIASKEQAKALHAELNKFYRKERGDKRKSKPILKPIGQTVTTEKKIIIQQNPVDWDDIQNGTPFALDPNGTLIYTKAGASKALCLNTMSPVPVGGASVYRVFL